MAISLGRKAEINVTPMIDVLLVLLIIFMIIAPYSRGLNAELPQPAASGKPVENLSIWIRGDGTVRLNDEIVDRAALRERLDVLARSPASDVAFIGADRDLDFAEVADVIDLVKGIGVKRIALTSHAF